MHTNRLIHENSPYLLQHAHNPVDWYPWGEEALQRALSEDKPILISIGYAACHWCHVMERESFENDHVASVMNEKFINIKVDREERPDIDHIYMDAVQVMTGSGGWPLNVFLTPGRKPFYGGTYFPPVNAYNRNSWLQTLHAVSEAYTNRKTEVESQADNLTEHLIASNTFVSSPVSNMVPGLKELDLISENLLKSADKSHGGFGAAPKFPQTFSIQSLLRYYYFTKDPLALDHALISIDQMIYGGIYDQLGGGFARYSTDREWLAPHFEKMLYDNALLVSVMSEAYQLTKNERYSGCIKETIGFITRELMHEEGGFYSALDADSEGVEGKYYTWGKQEMDATLGEDSKTFCSFYNVHENGNWEHINILRILLPHREFALQNGLNEQDLLLLLDRSREKLLKVRNNRVKPALDDKILLSWNALMNIALCKAYGATGDEDYKLLAEKNMGFIEKSFHSPVDNGWYHTYKNGVAKYPAFLDDFAYLAYSYIHLQEITGNADYLQTARKLCIYVLNHFGEPETGLFYYTPDNQKDIIVRKKEIYDGATPSGNAVMALNLHYLGLVFNNHEWVAQSEKMTFSLVNMITKYPTSFGVWGINMQNLTLGMNEVAIVGSGFELLRKEFLSLFMPNRLLQTTLVANELFPLLAGKKADDGAMIYLCKNYSCKQPVSSLSQLQALL